MDDADVIVVVGVGSVQAEPDRVRAVVGVSVVGDTVGEALTAAAQAQERLVATLIGSGVRRESIQTMAYNAGRDYEGGDMASSRHRADVSLRLTLPDVGSAGELLAQAGEAVGDGFRVNGLWPDLADPESARRTARADAVGAARRQAEELATVAGVRLGRLRSLVEGGGGGWAPFPASGHATAMAAAAPGVEGGELAVRVAVTATYEIEQ
jgi:uncharacterized protein YggE